jgi:hypothetical protein
MKNENWKRQVMEAKEKIPSRYMELFCLFNPEYKEKRTEVRNVINLRKYDAKIVEAIINLPKKIKDGK